MGWRALFGVCSKTTGERSGGKRSELRSCSGNDYNKPPPLLQMIARVTREPRTARETERERRLPLRSRVRHPPCCSNVRSAVGPSGRVILAADDRSHTESRQHYTVHACCLLLVDKSRCLKLKVSESGSVL